MRQPMDLTEKLLRREDKYKGILMDVHVDTVELPNGGTSLREVADHTDGVAVLPLDERNNVLVVSQYRYVFGRTTLEIPAGAVNYLGEPKEECAARELEEETGYRAGTLEWLMNVNTTVAFCNEFIGVYVAQNLIPAKQHLDEDEFLNVEEHELEELLSMVYDGTITDAKTLAALLAYRVKYR